MGSFSGFSLVHLRTFCSQRWASGAEPSAKVTCLIGISDRVSNASQIRRRISSASINKYLCSLLAISAACGGGGFHFWPVSNFLAASNRCILWIIAFLCFLITLPGIFLIATTFAFWHAKDPPVTLQSGSGSISPSGFTT